MMRSLERSWFPLLVAGLACRSPVPESGLALESRVNAGLISIADPSEPLGVSPSGMVVARVVVDGDTGYRLLDSAGMVRAAARVPGIGLWLAGPTGGFYTMSPGASGVLAIDSDGNAGATVSFKQPGIVRGVWGDSIDVVRMFADGFKVVRLASGGGGEREWVGSATPTVTEMLGIGSPGAKIVLPDAALPSVTTTPTQVVIGNGNAYRLLLFDRGGKPLGEISRQLPVAHPTERQINRELNQLKRSQRLTDQYLASLREQIKQSKVPFFTPQQGVRFDGAGRLWVVGYEADSAFADVFADTVFVRRFSLPCPGFDGGWDVSGEWLVVGCGKRNPAVAGGDLLLYRIIARR